MTFCTARKLRSQACFLLGAWFLLAQPLAEYRCIGVSTRCADVSSCLAVAAAGLSPLGVSIESVHPGAWHQTPFFGRGKHLFPANLHSIEAPVNEAGRLPATGPACYIARPVFIETGRSPPIVLS
jgi:hypothetical protein